MYVCKSIDRTVVSWFARIGYAQPLICPYTDCAPCTAIRRASKVVAPSVTDERSSDDDPDSGPMPTWDDAYDPGRSPL